MPSEALMNPFLQTIFDAAMQGQAVQPCFPDRHLRIFFEDVSSNSLGMTGLERLDNFLSNTQDYTEEDIALTGGGACEGHDSAFIDLKVSSVSERLKRYGEKSAYKALEEFVENRSFLAECVLFGAHSVETPTVSVDLGVRTNKLSVPTKTF